MYACICHAVTDSAVDAAIRCGAHTVEQVGTATRAGTGCGSCQEHLCDRIQRLTASWADPVAAAS